MGKRSTAARRRLSRKESFFGLHFDFHAGPDCTQVGRAVTRRMVERIIDAASPDYIQCDCKGHRGLSSYPTRVGHAAPGFVRDPLRIFRDATAARGVALYVHYSGVWDAEAVRRHPSWARLDEHGKRDKKITSVFGPYVDRLMIPQLRELCDDYDVDGVWVDGDGWSACLDYRPDVLRAFRAATGIRSVPRRPGQPHFFAFAEFCREGFRRYLRHYVDALHRHRRSFQIGSNWTFSSNMPECVSAGVDYLSGDFSSTDSVNAARLEARCLAPQRRPWDLMAWSFAGKWGMPCRSSKSAVQLQQEAAVVLALGGGFQAYFKQKRDGSIYPWQTKLMGEIATFCRARQAICHRAESVPQVGLILSSAAYYRISPRCFSHWHDELVPLAGVLRALLDSQYSVEVLLEAHLAGRMGRYPLLVVPEWAYLPAAFKRDLLSYAAGGGRLLAIGPASAGLFRRPLGVRFVGEPRKRAWWIEHGGRLGATFSACQAVRLGKAARGFGRLFAENDPRSPAEVAASVARWGRGRIAAVYFDFGERYVRAATAVARDFLAALVRELWRRPMVEVAGSHCVDVCLMQKDGRLSVNLVNTGGPHADAAVRVHDEVPPVGPLRLVVRLPRRPRRIRLVPAGQVLPFTWRKGEASLTVDRVGVHEVVVVE